MAALISQAGERERPQSTLRSYCNQECEGISREAKQRWADWEGHTWFSREHDGLVVGLVHGTRQQDAEREATMWAGRALGYHQQVTAKPMPATNPSSPWEWERKAPEMKTTQLPPTGEGSRVKEAIERAHRNRADVDITVDTLITGGDRSGVRANGWRTVECSGHLEQRIWRCVMLAERGYVQTDESNDTDPPTMATQIISQHFESNESDNTLRVTPDTHDRNRGGTRRATTTQNITPTQEHTTAASNHPHTTAINNPPPQAPPQGTEDVWANLAGDARMTGQDGGLPQCSLAAARNASRNRNLTEHQFTRWCDDGDILAPLWCNFLTDCCAADSEVAIPVDKEMARTSGHSQIRIAVMQTNRGQHAITLIAAGDNTFRRYDNDDDARRTHGTFTWVTWADIMQEWDVLGVAMYALVQGGAPLTHAQRIATTRTRAERRRRVNELIQAGIHDAAERSRILRTEDRQRQVNTNPNPNQHNPNQHNPGSQVQSNTTANLHLQQATHTIPQYAVHFHFPALDTQQANQQHTTQTLHTVLQSGTQSDPTSTTTHRQPNPHSHAQPLNIHTAAQAQPITAPRYAEGFHFPALQQHPTHQPPTPRTPTAPHQPNTSAATAHTTGHRQSHILAHDHLQPTSNDDDTNHGDQPNLGTAPAQSSMTESVTTPVSIAPSSPMRKDSTTQPQPQPIILAAAAQSYDDQTNVTAMMATRANETTTTTPERTTRTTMTRSSGSRHSHTQPLQPAHCNQPGVLHGSTSSHHVQSSSSVGQRTRGDALAGAAAVAHGPASSRTHRTVTTDLDASGEVSPSSSTRGPVSPITPRLLACAQILSGRNLLTESDIARFGRQHFDHCAFLTEHVCTDDQIAVHVQPQSLSPVMTTFIASALLTTSANSSSAIIRARTADGRTRFDLFTPEPPAYLANPQRIAPAFIAGPMALANIVAIFAVVPRTSPLAVPHTRTLPPPAPPRGGGRGESAFAARVFQHDVGVAAPT